MRSPAVPQVAPVNPVPLQSQVVVRMHTPPVLQGLVQLAGAGA